MLSLNPLKVNDANQVRFLYEVRSHPEVTRWLHSPPLPFPQHAAWVKKNVDHRDRSIFMLELEEDPIGFAQLTRRGGSLELGWALHPSYHGKGLGREAVWAWLAYCSGLPDQKLSLTVKESNARAIKLYEEAGFKSMGYGGPTLDTSPGLYYERENDVAPAVLTYVGHAGFQIEHDGVRFLCDPWFNSAFYDSWTPNPPNAHVLNHLDAPTHVYISHAHEDHFDAKFLNRLSRETEMIVPYWLEEPLRRMGFKFMRVFHADGEQTVLQDSCGETGINLTMFLDERKRDSALLIKVNGKKILNLNDCHLPIEKLPKADVLFCQFSGAFHYPHCYDFGPIEQLEKVHEVRERYVQQLIDTAKATDAELYIPSAGPPWLANPELNRSDSIFYRWHSVAERFQECIAAELQPGDDLLLAPGRSTWIKRPKWFLSGLLRERLDREVPAYFRRLNFKHRRLLYVRPKSFYLDYGTGQKLVFLGGDEGIVFDKTEVIDERANYTLHVRPEMMLDILRGGRWDAAFLSNKIRLHRDRDVYDAELFQALYNDRPEDRELAPELNPEMVDRGDGISHQRFCPHQGADLSFAPMEVDLDGKRVLLKCPRHGWKWDIKTGKCISGGEQPICVRGSPP